MKRRLTKKLPDLRKNFNSFREIFQPKSLKNLALLTKQRRILLRMRSRSPMLRRAKIMNLRTRLLN
jgi:hypothetical protein